ncbi:hypothetical protein ACA910_015240 [Epithemia clementina (nom. ined.)]
MDIEEVNDEDDDDNGDDEQESQVQGADAQGSNAQGVVPVEPETGNALADDVDDIAVVDVEEADLVAEGGDEAEAEEENIAGPEVEESENKDPVYSHAQQLAFAYEQQLESDEEIVFKEQDSVEVSAETVSEEDANKQTIRGTAGTTRGWAV